MLSVVCWRGRAVARRSSDRVITGGSQRGSTNQHKTLVRSLRIKGTGLMADIDSCCKAAGFWPDAVLFGHAHLYQRFTRVVNGRQTPYIVAGSGGFAATLPQSGSPKAPCTIGDHTLEFGPLIEFGYLTVSTDARTLTIGFKTAPRGGTVKQVDSVTLDLSRGALMSPNAAPPAGPGSSSPVTRPRPARSGARRPPRKAQRKAGRGG
jgi:hypothetical protein